MTTRESHKHTAHPAAGPRSPTGRAATACRSLSCTVRPPTTRAGVRSYPTWSHLSVSTRLTVVAAVPAPMDRSTTSRASLRTWPPSSTRSRARRDRQSTCTATPSVEWLRSEQRRKPRISASSFSTRGGRCETQVCWPCLLMSRSGWTRC